MKERKKYSIVEVIVVVFCSLGCLLLIAPKFIDTDMNLSSIALAVNGVGIMAFLYYLNTKKVD